MNNNNSNNNIDLTLKGTNTYAYIRSAMKYPVFIGIYIECQKFYLPV